MIKDVRGVTYQDATTQHKIKADVKTAVFAGGNLVGYARSLA